MRADERRLSSIDRRAVVELDVTATEFLVTGLPVKAEHEVPVGCVRTCAPISHRRCYSRPRSRRTVSLTGSRRSRAEPLEVTRTDVGRDVAECSEANSIVHRNRHAAEGAAVGDLAQRDVAPAPALDSIAVVDEYLHDVPSGEVPTDHPSLENVRSLAVAVDAVGIDAEPSECLVLILDVLADLAPVECDGLVEVL